MEDKTRENVFLQKDVENLRTTLSSKEKLISELVGKIGSNHDDIINQRKILDIQDELQKTREKFGENAKKYKSVKKEMRELKGRLSELSILFDAHREKEQDNIRANKAEGNSAISKIKGGLDI